MINLKIKKNYPKNKHVYFVHTGGVLSISLKKLKTLICNNLIKASILKQRTNLVINLKKIYTKCRDTEYCEFEYATQHIDDIISVFYYLRCNYGTTNIYIYRYRIKCYRGQQRFFEWIRNQDGVLFF